VPRIRPSNRPRDEELTITTLADLRGVLDELAVQLGPAFATTGVEFHVDDYGRVARVREVDLEQAAVTHNGLLVTLLLEEVNP
jgi:hypothetical protein